jgi:putative transposase
MEPTAAQRDTLERHRDIYRQAYNHFLYRLNQHDETPEMTTLRDELPGLKKWWNDLSDVYSRALQKVVERLYDNLESLTKLKENGYNVGSLNWKPPREYRSFTYTQSGFKLDRKGGRTVLHLSKIGDIPLVYHREISDNAVLKEVHVKQEPTGKWFASVVITDDERPPEKPDDPERCVGIDVGILKYTHDTDGRAVGSVDLSAEQERLEHEQRVLSRKEQGSNNYRKQQRTVARRHADIKRKRRDFLHKLSTWYAEEYDLVTVEKLDVKGLMELPSNSHNRASAAWATFRQMLQWKCKREGTHFVAVDPSGTTKECAKCGVETEKPLWVREHSCPACGFEADRDANAAWNVLQRGLDKLDIGTGSAESTPSETATAVETAVSPVSASRVVEEGSPTLKRSPAVRNGER